VRERKERRRLLKGSCLTALTVGAIRQLKGTYSNGKSYRYHRGRGHVYDIHSCFENERTCHSPEGAGAYTVFAPTDAAFAQMKAGVRDDLFDDYYNLSKVVKYHVVMGIYKAADLLDVIFLKTMEGQRLTIRSSASEERTNEKLEDDSNAHSYVVKDTVTSTLLESIKVNGANITRANVSADNGIVHVIDKVLVPRFMIL
jgi:uncharacterized surface protein with fasciclin (FAS1) repeats